MMVLVFFLFSPCRYPGSRGFMVFDTVNSDVEERDRLIRSSDVILLVLDASKDWAQAARETWFPLLKSLGAENTPVVVAASKMDLNTDGEEVTRRKVFELMRDHAQVESFNEVVGAASRVSLDYAVGLSDKLVEQVELFFYAAFCAVSSPLQPIYDSGHGRLTVRCAEALTLVFHALDEDADQALSMGEMVSLQQRVFGLGLTSQEMAIICEMIRPECPEGLDARGNITLPGFLFVMTKFVDRSRPAMVWKVLSHFGFDQRLRHHGEKFVGGVLGARCHQLSAASLAFLDATFKRAATAEGYLELPVFEALVGRTPGGSPFGPNPFAECEAHRSGAVTASGFRALFARLAFQKPALAASAMFGLGFPVDKPHAPPVLGVPSSLEHRSVFSALVIGLEDSGKTALVRALASKPFVEGLKVPARAVGVVGDQTLIVERNLDG